MLAVIVLGASWFLVSQLQCRKRRRRARSRKARNAEVLNRAKQALIGYVAAQAASVGEDNPGALPCPEARGLRRSGREGRTAPVLHVAQGRPLPWRTLGTDKLVDSAGEPLWYVVSPGWAVTYRQYRHQLQHAGQLTVDGVANDAVALIIAPGPAFNVSACGRTARA